MVGDSLRVLQLLPPLKLEIKMMKGYKQEDCKIY
jgi:hypothetical protein